MNEIKLLKKYDYCYKRGYEDCINDIIEAIKIVVKQKNGRKSNRGK